MLEEGIYLGYIDTAVTTESGSKKTPAIAITFTVAHRAADGDWQKLPADAKATVWLYLSENAWPYTEGKLKQLGFNGDFADPKFGDHTIADGVQLQCKHEEYEGKTKDKWELFGGGGPSKADQSLTQILSARWKQNNGSKPAGKPLPPKRAAAPSPAPQDLKPADIPF